MFVYKLISPLPRSFKNHTKKTIMPFTHIYCYHFLMFALSSLLCVLPVYFSCLRFSGRCPVPLPDYFTKYFPKRKTFSFTTTVDLPESGILTSLHHCYLRHSPSSSFLCGHFPCSQGHEHCTETPLLFRLSPSETVLGGLSLLS